MATANEIQVQPHYLTVRAAAVYSALSERTIRKLLAERRLTMRRVGTRILVSADELKALIEGGSEK